MKEVARISLETTPGQVEVAPDGKASHTTLAAFLTDVMRRKSRGPSQMARDIAVSHPTVGRWLSGDDVPSSASCRKLADYGGVPLEKVLALAGHLPLLRQTAPADWPEFREYARRKYPQLDEDFITMIEVYLERRRAGEAADRG